MRRGLAIAAVVLAGCGSSGRGEVAGPVERHLRGLAEGDFAGACRELTLAAQGEVIGLVAQVDGRRRSCRDAYSLVVSVIDVSDAHAQARVSGSKKVIALERGGDGWKISRLDFTDLP
jgi:hypothetical protein